MRTVEGSDQSLRAHSNISTVTSLPSRGSVGEFLYTHYIFFAANPRSGDQKAAVFLNKQRNLQVRLDQFGFNVYAHLFNVLDDDDSKRSYRLIQKTV